MDVPEGDDERHQQDSQADMKEKLPKKEDEKRGKIFNKNEIFER
jgi:hypothetical protein